MTNIQRIYKLRERVHWSDSFHRKTFPFTRRWECIKNLWILLSSYETECNIFVVKIHTRIHAEFSLFHARKGSCLNLYETHQINLCHYRLHVVHVTSKIISDSNRSHKNQLTFIYKMKCIFLPLDFNWWKFLHSLHKLF